MKVFEIARIILFAPDVKATANFYSRAFGFSIVSSEDDAGFIELDAGACRLAIHRGTPTSGRGAPKVVFRSRDVAGDRTRLAKEGIKLGPILEAPGFEFCDGQDPAGNIYQVSSRP